MQSNQKNTTEIGAFVSMTRRQKNAQIFSENKIEQRREKKTRLIRDTLHSIVKKTEEIPDNYRKLIARTAVCVILALGIWGIKNVDSVVTDQVSQGINSATSGESEIDEDLGKLKFVSGRDAETDTVYSLPLEGEIIASFADTEKDVQIQSELNADVKAILSGTVILVGEDTVIIENDNGTQTTYSGIVSSVTAGDMVQSADVIGQLAGEILCLETVSGIGYVDSLDATELNTTVADVAS